MLSYHQRSKVSLLFLKDVLFINLTYKMAQIEPNDDILKELYDLMNFDHKVNATISYFGIYVNVKFTLTGMLHIYYHPDNGMILRSCYDEYTAVLKESKNPTDLESFNKYIRLIEEERKLHVSAWEYGKMMNNDTFKQSIALLKRLYIGSMTKSAFKKAL